MNRRILPILFGAVLTLVMFAVSVQNVSAQYDYSDRGDFLPIYPGVRNPSYRNFDISMRKQKILETFTKDLNSILKLPTNIKVVLRDCGQPNAFYNPNNKTMTMCYEFMELFYREFIKMGYAPKRARAMMFGATLFFSYHELGHALIDVYELPAVGREEDAVDQLSTAILMDDLTDTGTVSALAGILIFKALSKNETPTKRSYADEHSLSSVRFYNIACWMYGRSPTKFSSFVTNGVLPRKRAARCPSEYAKMSRAWEKLLQPWAKRNSSLYKNRNYNSQLPEEISDVKVSKQPQTRVYFDRGKSYKTVKDSGNGYEFKDYLIRANSSQTLRVTLSSINKSIYFVVFDSNGNKIGNIVGQRNYSSKLNVSGDYRIRVFMPETQARNNSSATYSLKFTIN